MHAFCVPLNFAVFKIRKTASKTLKEEQHGQPKDEEFEAFERVTLLFLQKLLKSFLMSKYL